MATQGDSLLRKTKRGLSILAFETTKQSRILKKRMRTAALQKEIKADLRDLGNLVYNAVIHSQPGILEEEEVKILVENIRQNKDEVEHLRDAIARLSRTRKHFQEGEGEEEEWDEGPEPSLDEPPEIVVETTTAPPPVTEDKGVSTEREMKADILQTEDTARGKKAAKKKGGEEEEPAVPPAPGTDPEHPGPAKGAKGKE